ncbi:MAG: hypothetical protein R3F59_29310 [Myxococcota bacterium]
MPTPPATTSPPPARSPAHLGVAPSTAWLLNQKFAALTSLLQKGIQHLPPPRPHRPPSPSGLPTSQLGPPASSSTRSASAKALVCLPTTVPATLSPCAPATPLTGRADGAAVDYMRHEVAGWLQSRIEKFHDKVSLRWLPRWVDAYLHLATSTCGPRKCRKITGASCSPSSTGCRCGCSTPGSNPRPPDPPSLAWLRANVGKP